MSIIFENSEVWGFEHAIRGMRNPLNSWDKSDSDYCSYADCKNCCHYDRYDSEYGCVYRDLYETEHYVIGSKDMDLCQRLIKGGPEHRKFLRQIFISVDITAPLYWWKEFDTYKVGTVANSCSTMHTIHKKEFTLDDFACDKLISFDPYNPDWEISWKGDPKKLLEDLIEILNYLRERYLETKDKKYWYSMIQLLPTSYLQMRTVTLNYEIVRSMYFQRKSHKLDEWSVDFCNWVKTLPYAEELIMYDPK